jgi:hypothetical protein
MGHQDESLIDKVKNALGMGDDEAHDRHDHAGEAHDRHDHAGEAHDHHDHAGEAHHADSHPSQRSGEGATDEGSGLGRNPGPVGSAEYEGGATPTDIAAPDRDADGTLDTTREDAVATEHGGAYGHDDTPMPTSAAWDRGEAPPEASGLGDDDELGDRRDRGA